MNTEVSCLIAAFLFGVVGTWLVRKLALQFGIVNAPNPIIPQHQKPIAYLGGIGIAIGCIGIISTALWVPEFSLTTPNAIPFWSGAFALLVFGTLDDLKPLTPGVKFLLQAIIVVATVALGLVYPLTDSWILNQFLTVFWILTMINATNFTDVCDGLVGGVIAISMFFLGLAFPEVRPIAWGVAGACVGFLVFNSPPASIFLGDGGSHMLGFMLATMPLLSRNSNEWPIAYSLSLILISGLLIFELVFVTIVRIQKGLPWWRGSPDHFSLRLQHGGYSRWKTVGIAYAITVMLGLVAWSTRFVNMPLFALLVALVLVVLGWFWRFLLPMDPEESKN